MTNKVLQLKYFFVDYFYGKIQWGDMCEKNPIIFTNAISDDVIRL